MFERFTEQARQVVVMAQDAARHIPHNWIGAEHLLLGLLADPDSIAAQALGSLNVTTERVRTELVRVVPPQSGERPMNIPFTPQAKRVLEDTVREALHRKKNQIGPEHILLALAREDGLVADILTTLGAPRELVRDTVEGLLPADTREVPSWRATRGPRPPRVAPPVRVPAGRDVDRLLMTAAARALDDGRAVTEIADLLRALPRNATTKAWLASLGVDIDAMQNAIEQHLEADGPPGPSG